MIVDIRDAPNPHLYILCQDGLSKAMSGRFINSLNQTITLSKIRDLTIKFQYKPNEYTVYTLKQHGNNKTYPLSDIYYLEIGSIHGISRVMPDMIELAIFTQENTLREVNRQVQRPLDFLYGK